MDNHGEHEPEKGVLLIVEARSASEVEEVRRLFVEYREWLGFQPCFRRFDDDTSDPLRNYGPPNGCMLLARLDDIAAGCVALRALADGRCDMKRLYVRPRARGKRVGYGLARATIEKARAMGYRAMRLETLPRMKRAIEIYEALGFEDIAPDVKEPIAGARYMELTL